MAQSTTDIIKANMETVAEDLPELYDKAPTGGTTYEMVKKAAKDSKIVETVDGKDYRVPFKAQKAGVFGTFDREGGSLGSGSGAVIDQFYQTFFDTKLAISINVGAIQNTKGAQSVIDAWKMNMKDAIPNFKSYSATGFQSLSSGNQGLVALLTASTAPSGGESTLTFDTEHSTNLLQEGQKVEIFSNDLLTHRTTGVTEANLPYVHAINREAGTCVITGLSAITPGQDDYLAFPGVGATPAWMNGSRYFHRTSTSGSVLGVSATTRPEILPNKVNANGSLVPMHGELLRTRIRQRRGDLSKVKGAIHDAQVAQIKATQISIMELTAGATNEMVDLLPTSGQYVKWANVTHLVDLHQSKKRIDWYDLSVWHRVTNKELDFYTNPGSGEKIFEGRNSSGEVTASWHYFLWLSENFACVDPGRDGFIYGLSIPTDF